MRLTKKRLLGKEWYGYELTYQLSDKIITVRGKSLAESEIKAKEYILDAYQSKDKALRKKRIILELNMLGAITKTCNYCHEDKSLTEFTRDRTKTWGRKDRCKSCTAKTNVIFNRATRDDPIVNGAINYAGLSCDADRGHSEDGSPFTFYSVIQQESYLDPRRTFKIKETVINRLINQYYFTDQEASRFVDKCLDLETMPDFEFDLARMIELMNRPLNPRETKERKIFLRRGIIPHRNKRMVTW